MLSLTKGHTILITYCLSLTQDSQCEVCSELINFKEKLDLRRDENFEAGLRRNTDANRLSKDQKVITENRR